MAKLNPIVRPDAIHGGFFCELRAGSFLVLGSGSGSTREEAIAAASKVAEARRAAVATISE